MGTTAEKLAYLAETKEQIKTAIESKGVEIPDGTTFRQYADKIGEISGGGATTGKYHVVCVDYDGTMLKEAWLDNGAEFELPSAPSHDGLVFESFVASAEIVDNKIVVPDNDVVVSCYYHTASGMYEAVVEITPFTSLTVQNSYGGSTTDWGDGTTDTATEHTYSDYGTYLIKSTREIWGYSSVAYQNMMYAITEVRYPASHSSPGIAISSQHVNLKGVAVPSSVGIRSATHCESLRCVIASDVAGEFNQCFGLRYILVPYGRQALKTSTYNCGMLELFPLPETVTQISLQNTNSAYVNGTYAIKSIYLPYSLQSFGNYDFMSYVYNLGVVETRNCIINKTGSIYRENRMIEVGTLPDGFVGTTPSQCFYNCMALREVIMHAGITAIGQNFVSGNSYALRKMTFLGNITDINASAWSYMDGYLEEVDFSHCTQVPVLHSANQFRNGVFRGIIKVPAALYDEWIAAQYWSNVADRIVAVGE